MPSYDHLTAFAVATLAFAVFPGPSLLFTAAQTLARGRRAGLLAALGIHIGCYVHVLLATLGISALLAYAPPLYWALKLAGAAYLIWLGIGFLRDRGAFGGGPPTAPRSDARLLADSVLVEIFNPKVALFFAAFLPQFVDPAAALPIWLQSLILGVIVNFAFTSADVVAVFAAGLIQRAASRNHVTQKLLRTACGALLVGLGVKLAMDRI